MRKRPRWRSVLTVLGALAAVVLWSGYLITRIPAVQRALILKEHRELMVGWNPNEFYGGWGWAERGQLHQESPGSWLLKDSRVVEHRIHQMDSHRSLPYYPYSGEWALLFAARRLQGQTNSEIFTGPDGLTLGTATLVAEADPPNWWRQASWLGKEIGVAPSDSFGMGLLGIADVEFLVSRIEQCDIRQTAALVAAVLEFEELFTLDQREAILERWLAVQSQDKEASPNNIPSLEHAFTVRRELRQMLSEAKAIPTTPLAVSFQFKARLSGHQRHEIREAVMGYLRSLGYRPRLGESGTLRFEVEYSPVEFEQVFVAHAEEYSTTHRTAHRSYSRYSGSQTTYKMETREQTRWTDHLESTAVPSFVMNVSIGSVKTQIVLPPFEEFNQRTRDRVLPLFDKSELKPDELFTWNWCIENYALRPWRLGLEPYRDQWSFEEL